jgi:hypothetical protein
MTSAASRSLRYSPFHENIDEARVRNLGLWRVQEKQIPFGNDKQEEQKQEQEQKQGKFLLPDCTSWTSATSIAFEIQ